MRNRLTKISVIAGVIFFACSADARPPVKAADQAMEAAPDPKKKKAGEDCKTSDECKRHHTCNKAGEKSVCTAPPYAEIPKT
jgi:hypothetical protein